MTRLYEFYAKTAPKNMTDGYSYDENAEKSARQADDKNAGLTSE